MSRTKFATRGRRLHEEYKLIWHRGEEDFCNVVGINAHNLRKYFSGERDPLLLADELHKLGMDIYFIVTGKHFIGFEELLKNDLLHRHNADTYDGLKKILSMNKRCEKCRIDDAPFGDRAKWIHSLVPMNLNEFACALTGLACILSQLIT